MSFTIFQNEKKPFQAIKTRSSKSRKIDIFSKGLTHDLVQKWPFFQVFFQVIQARKMSFTVFQNEKTPFQVIKTRISKFEKWPFFSKGLTHGFGPKMTIFPNFFFSGNIIQENVFYDILERKNAFQGYINKNLNESKNWHFPKEVINPCF